LKKIAEIKNISFAHVQVVVFIFGELAILWHI